MKALTSPAYAKLKNVPKVANEEEAILVLHSIIPYAFYLRVDRESGGSSSAPKRLTLNPTQMFNPSETYAWFYEGPQWTTYVGAIVMVVVMLAAVMFPLWPPILRLGVWYLSIGVLGLIGVFIAIAIVRLIFYIITIVIVPPGIWIFPKLFADVGVVSKKNTADCCLTYIYYRLSRSYLFGNGTFLNRSERRSEMARANLKGSKRSQSPVYLRMEAVHILRKWNHQATLDPLAEQHVSRMQLMRIHSGDQTLVC